ncbi:MAG: hypothetical protein FWF94_01865 [Oscillospiraceae bacterium]|nr:hypothetical protein [Oscillospiraceae bacterium]
MSNKLAFIITGIVALIAIATVILTVLIVSDSNGENNGLNPDGSQYSADTVNDDDFIPDELLEQEMRQAAARLVQDNFEVFKLYYLVAYDAKTHFKPEPFGNQSEDGYRTLKEGVIEFNTVGEIFALIDATFTANAAEVIKDFSSQTSDGTPVYKERDGGIGVNETYVPKTYELAWGDVEIALTFVSEVESIINVSLKGNDDEAEGNGESENEKQIRMIKEDDGIWRLENVFF